MTDTPSKRKRGSIKKEKLKDETDDPVIKKEHPQDGFDDKDTLETKPPRKRVKKSESVKAEESYESASPSSRYQDYALDLDGDFDSDV